jgi:transposase InsO family protein/transposase-like protein
MEAIEKLKRRRPKGSGKRHPKTLRYTQEFKVQAVKLYLEEGYSSGLLSSELGIAQNTICVWAKLYQKYGEAGLVPRRTGSGKSSLAPPIKEAVVNVKQSNPGFGSKRISQVLRRIFFLPASPETVRKTLHEESLMSPKLRKKPKRNITRPRFFQRTTPNQMWQTDIFTFRLGGRNAYLIGYIDDYSRYITGMELFRSQTGEHVIEVYRKAMAEYNPPKEMLTDNGRQYTNWRGTTRFEAELKKDNIHHIKSRPHHPMTLGKIERFWKTIYQEFLSRAQFMSFDDARDRIRVWVKYYNHQRPHQGILGLCPADRYFEIQSELRKAIEQGIKDNMLEIALRGKPKKPFYMVGRMDGKSVVVHAEKGKVKMSVNDEELKNREEMVYNLKEGDDTNGKEENTQDGKANTEAERDGQPGLQRDRAVPGGPVGVVRTPEAFPGVPGAVDPDGDHCPLAETGPGGYVAGPGAADEPDQGCGPFPPPAGPPGAETADHREQAGEVPEAGEPLDPDTGHPEQPEEGNQQENISQERSYEEPGNVGPATGDGDHEGEERGDNGHGGSEETGNLPQDILPVGKAGIRWDDEGPGEPECGPACPRCGYREGTAEEEEPGTGAGAAGNQAAVEGQRPVSG